MRLMSDGKLRPKFAKAQQTETSWLQFDSTLGMQIRIITRQVCLRPQS
jgi:hypothetical protein